MDFNRFFYNVSASDSWEAISIWNEMLLEIFRAIKFTQAEQI